MKKIFLSLFSFFFLFSPAFAETIIPVEDIFSDINKDYKYYKEVQELYNRGMIFPDENGKLNPEKLLARDEFVGISIEVICKKCIQPNTALDLLESYTGKDIYFDINEKNKYFYCVAEADAKDYVRGYVAWDKCEDGTYKIWERPFCSNNTITREEAYAVILRNSKILTIEENEKILQEIKNGTITESLSQDVIAQNLDKTPYTFYGYFKKALEYELVEYDNLWNKKIYKLLEKKDNKIYPKKAVTKEEFIYMAYIALRANNCKEDVVKNDIALKMKIYDKSCTNSSQNCNLSNLKDSNNTYDFKALVETTCEKWVKDKEWYIWRFYNTSSWEKIIKYGSYIDNYSFLTNGTWEVYLRVIDNCWNTAEVFSTIVVSSFDKKENDNALNVSVDANPINWYAPLLVDFDSIVSWWDGKYEYTWDFWDGTKWYGKNIDHIFQNPWVYEVILIVKDGSWKVGKASVIIHVLPKNCLNDSDKDGIGDCDDLCPLVFGEEINKWCPVLLKKCDKNCACPTGYKCNLSDTNICPSQWICQLISNLNTGDCLYDSGKDTIIWNVACNTCPCSNFVDFISSIRKCDVLFPAITSPDSTEIYSRGKTYTVK